MAEELLNGVEPIEIEDKTKLLFGLRKKSDGTLKAVTKEDYSSYDKRSWALDGIVVRNEDEDVNLLCDVVEKTCIYGDGPLDIPETDKRRKNAPSNPSFNELDGQIKTQYQLDNHAETHESGCAICEAVKFGWLPSCGEMGKIVGRKEAFDELAEICGGDKLLASMYYCSTQYNPDYMWCYNMQSQAFEFWHSKTTQMGVRAVKSAADYIEDEE